MTKRKRQPSIGEPHTSIGERPRFRMHQQPPDRFQLLFNPLLDQNKIYATGSALSRSTAERNPLYKILHEYYNSLTPDTLELADFIIANSMRKDHHPYGNVSGINLSSKPLDSPYAGYHRYRPGTSLITIHADYPGINPISTLIHEGTHALDNLLMRTYQDQALSSLADFEGKADFNPKDILVGAQRILPEESKFDERYPYDNIFGPDINRSFGTLFENDPVEPLPASIFSTAKDRLRPMLENNTAPNNVFRKFSEFPAFAMQYLHRPWQNPGEANPQSAQFMHDILSGVQGHFQNLGLNERAHPYITQSFDRRLQRLQEAAARAPLPAPAAGSAAAAPEAGSAAAAPAAGSAAAAPAAAYSLSGIKFRMPPAAAPAALGAPQIPPLLPIPRAAAPAPAPAPPPAAAPPVTSVGSPVGGSRRFSTPLELLMKQKG